MRRRGCGLTFSRNLRAIIRSATRNFEVEKLPVLTIPAEISDQYLPPDQDDLNKSLNDSSKELQTNNQSVQLSTLRLLATATEATKSHKVASQKLAETIMDGEDSVREICINLLSSEETDDVTFMIKRSVLLTFFISLDLLINVNTNQIFSEDSWYHDCLYPTLVEEIKDCACLQDCTLVAKCMALLCLVRRSFVERQSMMASLRIL